LVVDGVHGLGVEDVRMSDLGADAFSSGLHKWIFAPRGTGFVWAKPRVWASMKPLIPSFTSFDLFRAWGEEHPPTGTPDATSFARLSCGIMNTHDEVERAIAAVRAIS